MNNIKRSMIAHMEELSQKRIVIHSEPGFAGEKHKLVCYNEHEGVVKV